MPQAADVFHPARSFLLAGSRAGARPWCVALLLLAMVCAQALGFMHQVVHSHGQEHALQDHGHALGSGLAAPQVHAPGDWVDHLFSAHQDASDCRLFDGVGQQDQVLPVVPVPPVLGPCLALQRLLAGAFIARFAALFDARGPPPSR